MGALLFLAVLVIGSIGLMLQGDFGDAAIVLLILGMILLVARQPFAGMEPSDRRSARLTATALVLAGWFMAGILLWEWTGGSFIVAGVVAVIALGRAVTLPQPAATAQPESAGE